MEQGKQKEKGLEKKILLQENTRITQFTDEGYEKR